MDTALGEDFDSLPQLDTRPSGRRGARAKGIDLDAVNSLVLVDPLGDQVVLKTTTNVTLFGKPARRRLVERNWRIRLKSGRPQPKPLALPVFVGLAAASIAARFLHQARLRAA
jgi:hypothetical protein